METINTKKSKVVTRSYSSDEEVQASSFPRSSFSNTYHNAFDGIIGRLIPAAVFDVLPKSSFNGRHSGAIQLERMVTPYMPDTSAHSFTFYCSLRAVDRDFVETSAPSSSNLMAADKQYPMFETADVCQALFRYICNKWCELCGTDFNASSWLRLLSNFNSMTHADKAAWFSENDLDDSNYVTDCLEFWPKVYLSGLADDFSQYFHSFHTDEPTPISTVNAIYHTLVRFLCYACGEGSLLDYLGYPIIRQDYFWRLSSSDTISNWRKLLNPTIDKPMYCNEYRLRQLAAIWIEYFRQPMLQPLNSFLRYNRWDSVSILGTPSSSDTRFRAKPEEAMLLLFMRAVPFGEDRVTTAHIDDICRNVYAPIVSTNDGKVSVLPKDSVQATGAIPQSVHSGWQSVKLQSKCPDGSTISVDCPVPSMLGNFMNNLSGVSPASSSSLMLDLQTLKTADRLQRELKRRMWFGDSYFDVVRADYDCDISDADVLKPHLLGDGESSVIGANQEIASTDGASEDSPRGTRTAVGQGDYPTDSYAGFSQETGSVINLLYVSQRVSYDPADDFNFVRTYSDMIRPIYAGTNESIMHKFAVNRASIDPLKGYGFEPYGNYYRTRLDRAHGKFLREYKDYIALRNPATVQLSSDFLHQYQLPLGHFADTIMLDGQFNVLATHEFYVTHSLPAPVEII